MSQINTNVRRHSPVRLAFIQPVLAPYRRPLFELISSYKDIELKVFLCSASFPHRPGWKLTGMEGFDVEILKGLQFKSKSTIQKEIMERGLRVIPYSLTRNMIKFKPNIIICTSITEYLFLLPYKFLSRCKIGCWVEDTPYTVSQGSGLKQKARNHLYRGMDFWLANGKESVGYLTSIGVNPGKIESAFCSVDNEIYGNFRDNSNVVKSERARWISIGSLIERKGFDLLIRAWSMQAKDFHCNNELVIVGEGPEEQKLKNLMEELKVTNVHFVGYKQPDEVSMLLGNSDVFVFPTVKDIWGLVVNEAMASGLPIICSRYAGCHSDLVDDENGVLIDPLDIDGFSNEISKFENRKGEWDIMGRNSKKKISAYTTKNTADAILRVCVSNVC